MNEQINTGKILISLDGCRTIGYSQVLMINTLMHRIQRKEGLEEPPNPCDRIDMFGGVGMGGIVAIFLGRLRMGSLQAILEYERLSSRVYKSKRTSTSKARYDEKIFEKEFREIVERAGYNADELMEEQDGNCRTIVFALNTRNTEIQAIRSYRARSEQNLPCTILQAARSTMATPDLFSSVHIGNSTLGSELIGYFNNPVKLLLKEAGSLFPSTEKIAGILSLGVGKRGVIGVPKNPKPSSHITVLTKIAEDCETIHQEMFLRYQRSNIYYRLNVDQGLQYIEEDEWKRFDIIRHSTFDYLKEVFKKTDAIVDIFSKRVGGPLLRDLNSVAAQETIFPPPPSISRNFVGRKDLIDNLLTYHLKPLPATHLVHWITVLWGIGGIGKTQMSIKLWEEFKSSKPEFTVFFLDARSKTNLENDLRILIRSRDPRYWNRNHTDALVWLATTDQKWFMILDNADDPNLDLEAYIPKGHGNHLLITSRNSDHRFLAPDSNFQVGGLNPDESSQLLLATSSYNSTEANQNYAMDIVKELHFHSLAIVQSGGYIFKHRGLSHYLTLFREKRDKMLLNKDINLPDYQNTVYTTLQLSYDRLPDATRDVLQILSFLNSAQISEDIISGAATNSFIRNDSDWMIDTLPLQRNKIQETVDQLSHLLLPNGKWDLYDFNQVISPALQYSLLLVNEAEDHHKFYSMHAIIQSFLRYMSYLNKQDMQRPAVQLIVSNINLCESMIGFVDNQKLIPHIRSFELCPNTPPVNQYAMACVLRDCGDYEIAAQRLHSALTHISTPGEISKNRLTLQIELLLVDVWTFQGKYTAALELGEKLVKVNKEMFGEEHKDTLNSLNQLGIIRGHQGDSLKAEEIFTYVVEVRKRILGDEHPQTFRSMINLSASLIEKGDYSRAVEVSYQVLEIHRRVLGDENPLTIKSLHNLGLCLLGHGSYAKAMEICTLAVHNSIRVLGKEHPQTLVSMNVLGCVLLSTGNYEQAAEVHTQAVQGLRKIEGEAARTTLSAMRNLAFSLSKLGKYSEAAKTHRTVMKIRKRMFGSKHSRTFTSIIDFSCALSNLGRYAKAFKIQNSVLTSCREMLGEGCDTVLSAMSSLGRTLSRRQDHTKAVEMLKFVLEARQKVVGKEHPDTLNAMHNLAVAIASQGIYLNALSLFEQVIELRAKVLGESHPGTLRSKGWYSQVSELLNEHL